MIRELALFAGGGGGLLGSRIFMAVPVCAVELDPYAIRVLIARQRDGELPIFPIWDDVRTFDTAPWRGHVDLVSGGFPCQPFSQAARGRNVAVDLWPDMLRIVRELGPRYVFAENVDRAPVARAARDLADLGYVVRFMRLSAADVGAPHIRPRWWLFGDANGDGQPVGAIHAQVAGMRGDAADLWRELPRDALGMGDGLAHRMDRARLLGNGQVPRCAALAWAMLRTAK